MGFFDDFANAIQNVHEVMENARQERGSGNPNFDTPPPALPVRTIQTFVNNHSIQFTISQDFIEDAGYTSSVISFKYCPPGFENEYINDYYRYGNSYDNQYDPNEVKIFSISIETYPTEFIEIDELIENYVNAGNTSNIQDFTCFESGIYLFRASMRTGNYFSHIYVFRDGSENIDTRSYLLLSYEDKIQNTQLEKKLIACFNGVANSLTIS